MIRGVLVFYRALVRNVFSSGPAVVEPDLPSLTKTATARSSCMAIIQAWVFSGSDVPYSAIRGCTPDAAWSGRRLEKDVQPVRTPGGRARSCVEPAKIIPYAPSWTVR